jgi:hypothetical protein
VQYVQEAIKKVVKLFIQGYYLPLHLVQCFAVGGPTHHRTGGHAGEQIPTTTPLMS